MGSEKKKPGSAPVEWWMISPLSALFSIKGVSFWGPRKVSSSAKERKGEVGEGASDPSALDSATIWSNSTVWNFFAVFFT